MSCQLGIYPDRKAGIEDWDFLIYQQDHVAPRDILGALSPFLRTFHAEQGMSETGFLAAGLAWYLVDLRLDVFLVLAHRRCVEGSRASSSTSL